MSARLLLENWKRRLAHLLWSPLPESGWQASKYWQLPEVLPKPELENESMSLPALPNILKNIADGHAWPGPIRSWGRVREGKLPIRSRTGVLGPIVLEPFEGEPLLLPIHAALAPRPLLYQRAPLPPVVPEQLPAQLGTVAKKDAWLLDELNDEEMQPDMAPSEEDTVTQETPGLHQLRLFVRARQAS